MTVAAVIQRAKSGFTPYGGAARFMYCREPEVIIGGPYDTGKTMRFRVNRYLYSESRSW